MKKTVKTQGSVMKLVEGMKHLKLLEKRMQSNSDRITTYSAMVSNEKLYFNSDTDQQKEINSLIAEFESVFVAVHLKPPFCLF